MPDPPAPEWSSFMDWSIVDVARASGVTARTLRHYDAASPPLTTG
jgi:hypothetical protein